MYRGYPRLELHQPTGIASQSQLSMASTSAMSVPATSTKPSILQSIAAARSANLPPKPSSSTSTSTRAVPTSHTGSGGGFQGQDDFISFAELEADVAGRHTDSSNGILAKGKQRAGPGPAAAGEHKRGKKRPIADVLEEQGKTKLRDVDKATCVRPLRAQWIAALGCSGSRKKGSH